MQDVIDVLFAIAVVSAAMVTVIHWFLLSTVSGPLGPTEDVVETLATEWSESPPLGWWLVQDSELGRVVALALLGGRLVWRAVLKFALCNVLAYCGYRVLGYVLPFLRFFSQIPW